MTDEPTATLVAPDEAFDLDTELPSVETPVPFSQFPEAFMSAFDTPTRPATDTAGSVPPPLRLRTAWKRKGDALRAKSGKPLAKPALSRGAARSGARGVRTVTAKTDSTRKPAFVTPPLPSLTRVGGRAKPPDAPPVALQYAPPRAVVFYPPTPPITNPRAKPRGVAKEYTGQLPGGTIVARPGQQPKWPRIGRWLGNVLMVIGVLTAVGALGTNYFLQRHQQDENAQFVSDLSQFGPTPTPLTARATVIAARGSAGAGVTGIGVSVLPPPRPLSSAVPGVISGVPTEQTGGGGGLPTMRAATATPATTASTVSNAATAIPATVRGMADTPTRVPSPLPLPTMPPRPMGQPAPMAPPGGPPPIVAGIPPMMQPPAMATGIRPGEMPTPRPPTMNIAPPPIAAPVQPAPQRQPPPPPPSTAAPLPAPTSPIVPPTPRAMTGKEPAPMPMPLPTAEPEPTATLEPEATPEPEPPPRQPLPTHITIPSLRVNSDIIDVGISPTVIDDQQVYIWDVAAYTVGHHFSSANPGEGDNVVLSGHDDWQGEVFRDLYRLKKGDKIIVQAGDRTWSYHVETVLPLQEIGVPLEQRLNNALYIGSTGDERLTLVTCWPYGVDDHRLVVIARPD